MRHSDMSETQPDQRLKEQAERRSHGHEALGRVVVPLVRLGVRQRWPGGCMNAGVLGMSL